jgi:site-specific recombinase XerD
MLSQQELAALFGACDPDMPIDARNAAALAVMYGCGLRRQELSRLLLSDLREGDEPALRVLGKRNKERLVPVPDGARPHLAAWLRHRGRHPGRLFLRINGTVLGDPRRRRGEAWTDRDGISGKAVLDLLAAMARQAGVVSCTPHDLRRTYVSTLLQQGADLSVAQHLAGHDDAKTTARYDRRGEVAARRAAALLPWPSAHPAPTQPPGPAGGHPTGGAR